MLVIGLISGTSADGIESVLVEIRGAPPELSWRLVKHLHIPHPPALRDEILVCVRPERGAVDRLCALNFALGEAFANAARRVIEAAGMSPSQVGLIGSHGQTLWHIPSGPGASTLQLGEPALIAERTGITTISNFRTRDIAAGGQGAPLVAYVDVLLLSHPTLTRAAQNIGGIANVTFLPPLSSKRRGGGGEVAFDTGPGNVLLDYAASRATNGAWTFDREGALAARGRADEKLLADLMEESYLKLAPPKTTGRELFGAQYGAPVWEKGITRGLSAEDLLATLTAFTARSIAHAYRDFLPTQPAEVIVSGGGAHNPVLMQMLRELLSPARLLLSDELGLPTEAKEAIAFAVLAYETWHSRPGNLPSATGARRAVVLGNITPGNLQHPTSAFQLSILRLRSGQASNFPSLTESRNPATENIERLSTLDMLRQMNNEDAYVPLAVADELSEIAKAVDAIAERMRAGGRLVYVGAGTSGRLGVLDASELPPTFSTPPDLVVGVIAGGREAMFRAVEGAEDDADAGARDLAALQISENDSVVGLSASGRAPYVIGALKFARARGALTISLACNRPAPVQDDAEINIAPLVGAEVIAGSTRLKAGTAQKIILNMISTGVMIKLGKTYGNLMVDVQATNAKLRARAQRIVETACSILPADAEKLLRECNGEVKTAIVAQIARVAPEIAREEIKRAAGSVRGALRL